jgi:hypothetical protein
MTLASSGGIRIRYQDTGGGVPLVLLNRVMGPSW